MSQGTPISKLGGNSMNDEDSRLVDSILNDLNNSSPQQPSSPPANPPVPGGPPQQMTPEQHKVMLAQRQQAMMQQQMMMQQQAMQQQQQKIKNKENESIIEKLQSNWKPILIVMLIILFINTPIVDDIFRRSGEYFMSETGALNMQAILVKSIISGIVYFVSTSYLPL